MSVARHRKRRDRRRRAHNARQDGTVVAGRGGAPPVQVVRDELRHMTTADFERAARSAIDSDLAVTGSTARLSILDRVRRRPTGRTAPELHAAAEARTNTQLDRRMRNAFKGILTRGEAYHLNDRDR